jgi:hypothetical protein
VFLDDFRWFWSEIREQQFLNILAAFLLKNSYQLMVNVYQLWQRRAPCANRLAPSLYLSPFTFHLPPKIP